MFGYKDPSKAAKPYLDQIPGQTAQYQEPWINKGKGALDKTYDEYGNLIDNPGQRVNQIGESYQQSPGFQRAMQEALMGSNNAYAANGMAGSPLHSEANMDLASDIASKDYNNWLDKALGLYNTGLSGEQDISHMGQQSGQNRADLISQNLSEQAGNAYKGQANKNANTREWINTGLQVGGALASGGASGAFGNWAGSSWTNPDTGGRFNYPSRW